MRVAAAGVCHSDVRLADGDLGDGRWPTVLGHEGAGVVEAVGPGVEHRRARRPGRVLLRPAVPVVPARARRAASTSARSRGAHAWAGTMLDGTTRLHLADGRDVRHFNFVSCFAERCVVPAASAVPIPPELPLWQAALLGCAVVTGLRRGPQRRARRARRERVRDRLRRDRPADRRRGADGGRRAHRRGRPRPREARPRARAAARPTPSTRRSRTRAPPCSRSSPAASTTRSRRSARPATIRLAWDVIRPGATAIVVGIAPRGAEARVPGARTAVREGAARQLLRLRATRRWRSRGSGASWPTAASRSPTPSRTSPTSTGSRTAFEPPAPGQRRADGRGDRRDDRRGAGRGGRARGRRVAV